MACFHPLKAFKVGKLISGKDDLIVTSYEVDYLIYDSLKETYLRCKGPVFRKPGEKVITEFVEIPCGHCIGCRLKQSQEWADRCMLEAREHKHNYFITLTYEDDKIPKSESYQEETGEYVTMPTLCMRDVQLFFKRLRKAGKKFRYLYCGEYGSTTLRPHYHVLFFGLELDDLKVYKQSKHGFTYFNSDFINETWSKGYCVISELTWETAAYTARYSMKKAHNNLQSWYEKYNLVPEYIQMSRRPGIGFEFYKSSSHNIYYTDEIFIKTAKGVKKRKPPRYFDKLYEEEFPEAFSEVKFLRQDVAKQLKELKLSNTDLTYLQYLAVEEENKAVSISKLKREL